MITLLAIIFYIRARIDENKRGIKSQNDSGTVLFAMGFLFTFLFMIDCFILLAIEKIFNVTIF